MNEIITINGILMTTQNEFSAHAGNASIHVTAQEKEKWNSGGQGPKGDKGDPGARDRKAPKAPRVNPASRALPVHRAPKGTREIKGMQVPKVRKVPACLLAASCGSAAAQPRTAGWNAMARLSKSVSIRNCTRQSAPPMAAMA